MPLLHIYFLTFRITHFQLLSFHPHHTNITQKKDFTNQTTKFHTINTFSMQFKWLCCISLTDPEDAPIASNFLKFNFPFPLTLSRCSYIQKAVAPQSSSASPATTYFHFSALHCQPPCELVENGDRSCELSKTSGPFLRYSPLFLLSQLQIVLLYVKLKFYCFM